MILCCTLFKKESATIFISSKFSKKNKILIVIDRTSQIDLFASYIIKLHEADFEIHLAINPNINFNSFNHFLELHNLSEYLNISTEKRISKKIEVMSKNNFYSFYRYLLSNILKFPAFKFFHVNLVRSIYSMLLLKRFIRRTLLLSKYKWILLPTDVTSFTASWVKYGNQMGIKTAVIPWCLSDNSIQLVVPKKKLNSSVYFIYLRLLNRFWPGQLKLNVFNEFVTTNSFPEILLGAIFNLKPTNPWVVCGGDAGYIFTENQHMANFYRDSIPQKTILHGSFSPYFESCLQSLIHDKNYEVRKYLCDLYSFDIDRPILALAAPKYNFLKGLINSDLLSETAVIDDIVRILNCFTDQILVSIHPDRDDYDVWREKNVLVTNLPLSNFVAGVDLLVASASASFSLALARGISCVDILIDDSFFESAGSIYLSEKYISVRSWKVFEELMSSNDWVNEIQLRRTIDSQFLKNIDYIVSYLVR